jgi:hypothetical protein
MLPIWACLKVHAQFSQTLSATAFQFFRACIPAVIIGRNVKFPDTGTTTTASFEYRVMAAG